MRVSRCQLVIFIEVVNTWNKSSYRQVQIRLALDKFCLIWFTLGFGRYNRRLPKKSLHHDFLPQIAKPKSLVQSLVFFARQKTQMCPSGAFNRKLTLQRLQQTSYTYISCNFGSLGFSHCQQLTKRPTDFTLIIDILYSALDLARQTDTIDIRLTHNNLCAKSCHQLPFPRCNKLNITTAVAV